MFNLSFCIASFLLIFAKKKDMKTIVTVSGGKDSTATLLYTIQDFCGGKKDNILAIFCDTGFEHETTYNYLDYLEENLGIKIIRLRSKKFDNFIDMVKQKKRFPSSKARFCTTELKVKPMIDFILDNIQDDILVVQGIRAEESTNRSRMNEYCTYFKGYFEGKYTYRKKEVFAFCQKYSNEVWRPLINWNTQNVFDYIKKSGLLPNNLYNQGFLRVGCFPCIMATKDEIRIMIENFFDEIEKLKNYEITTNSTFFPPDYIPKRYCSKIVVGKNGKEKKVPTVDDVLNYINSKVGLRNKKRKKQTESLFENSCKNQIISCHF